MRPRILGVLIVATAALLWIARAEQPATVTTIAFDRPTETLTVSGLDTAALDRLRGARLDEGDWARLLAVHSTSNPGVPPMTGRWEVVEEGIRFRPRYPLVPGLPYRARFDGRVWQRRFAPRARDAEILELPFSLPRVTRDEATCVTAVHPTAGVLPANQLKFYIVFSSPMSAGEADQRVRLLDEAGNEVPRAFLRLEQELWNDERTRLTMILDPGRIKRGLRSNVEDGPPLLPGRTYRLAIDQGWPDGDGNPLCSPFEKTFRAAPPDRDIPDPGSWRVTAPRGGTTEALRLALSEPLDYALMTERIIVLDHRENVVDGRIAIADDGTEWSFVPTAPWHPGPHTIQVSAELEDLAGNDLRHLFDADLGKERRAAPDWIALPVAIEAGGLTAEMQRGPQRRRADPGGQTVGSD